MDELEFTIEFDSDLNNKDFEVELMAEAEDRLRELAKGHHDVIGAAVTIRIPAKEHTPPLYEATVVAYVRPSDIVGKEKADTARAALKGALDAVTRQLRQKRDKLGKPWEQPGNDPVSQEMMELLAAEEMEDEDIAEVDSEEG